MAAAKIPNTPDSWEEGLLGRDEKHVVVVGSSHEDALDEALGLQAISIRLPKQLVSQYKLIAHFHGVGYQPLMRDVLARFVPGAIQEILEAEKAKATQVVEQAPPPEPKRKAA
ncbi:MAG: hypothetical protein KGL43_04120 [Burkholderiales bacterium]|nr:hypothetical protein [Burkholderiales bacterium]